VSETVESPARRSEKKGMGSVFDFVSEAIERETDLDRLEARGTVRLALKEAGFDANTIRPQELAVVLEKVMPRELAIRGVNTSEDVCRRIVRSLQDFDDGADCDENTSPESVFARLAGK
jgi:hypothetical protein